MAGESINAKGSWATIQAANSTATGSFSAGTRTTITAALTTGSEDEYPLLDLQLNVSVGSPTENAQIRVYRRSKADGTNEAPAPAGSYLQEHVADFTIDNATGYYYLYGIPNVDENATYYLYNDDSVTLTIALAARGRGFNTAA